MLEAIYSFNTPFKEVALQKASNWIGLESLGNILTSYFQKGMDLENPMVGSKVMALGNSWCIDWCVIPIFVISRLF